jgi:hypothetical protein
MNDSSTKTYLFMKPLNREERNRAFYRFLLFFLITVGLIVTVVFFSIDIPIREGRQIRKQMFAMQNERAVTDSFNTAMKEAVKELEKFNLKAESPTAIRQRVEFRANEMDQLLKSIPNGENSVYALMIRNIRDLSEAKAKLSSLGQ